MHHNKEEEQAVRRKSRIGWVEHSKREAISCKLQARASFSMGPIKHEIVYSHKGHAESQRARRIKKVTKDININTHCDLFGSLCAL